MESESEYLKLQVDKIEFDETKFQIELNKGYYIFGAIYPNSEENKYFSISTIYDSIIKLIEDTKYSFYKAIECDLPEGLDNYKPFNKPDKEYRLSLYYIENMIFRTMVLWDLLGQVYNIYRDINKSIDKVYAHQLFHDCSQGKKADQFAKEVYTYMVEEDDGLRNKEVWKGNHKYIKKYRDQMTHRNSPGITSISSYNFNLRPPAIYILKRVTEDFIVVTKFIQKLIENISME